MLFNISNRHFDLEPVLGRLAEHLRLTGRVQLHVPDPEDEDEGATASRWVVLSRSPAAIEAVTAGGGKWDGLRTDGSLWTDDYSFVIGALTW